MVDVDVNYLVMGNNLDTTHKIDSGSAQNSDRMDCGQSECESESDMEAGYDSSTEVQSSGAIEQAKTTSASPSTSNSSTSNTNSGRKNTTPTRRGSGLGLFSTITSLISRGRSHLFSKQNGADNADVEEEKVAKMCKEDFTMLRVIGKGSFAKVILVKKKDTDQLYAMKVLSKPAVVKRKQVEHTKTERRVLEVVGHLHDHPYISQLHYAFQTDSKLYLVLHYCSGGEVFHHLQRMKRFPERWARLYAAELVLALSHLHKYNVAYRDLKPENILLDTEGHVKLCDFGLSKDGVSEPTAGAMSLCGTPEYLAPEVLDRRGHGTCVDWWGLGMVLYELLTGLPPWYTTDRKKLFARIRTAPLKFPAFAASNMSPEARGLITQLLNRDPTARLGGDGNVQAIKDHPFFTPSCGLLVTSVGHPLMDWAALMQRKIPSAFRPDSMVATEPQRYSHEQRAYLSREPERFREHTHVSVHALPGQSQAQQQQQRGASSSQDGHAALARNFDPEHARLPFDSEVSTGSAWVSSSYASPDVTDGMFTNFTFDEGSSPHLSLEEEGKTLSSVFTEETEKSKELDGKQTLAKRLNFNGNSSNTDSFSKPASVVNVVSTAEVEIEIDGPAIVAHVVNVQPGTVSSSGSLHQ